MMVGRPWGKNILNDHTRYFFYNVHGDVIVSNVWNVKTSREYDVFLLSILLFGAGNLRFLEFVESWVTEGCVILISYSDAK